MQPLREDLPGRRAGSPTESAAPAGSEATAPQTPEQRDAAARLSLGQPAEPTGPGFELLDELGRGGMGVVHRARDKNLRRDLAVKVLLSDNPRLRRRFFEEV